MPSTAATINDNSNDANEFQIVKEYLLQCPHVVPATSAAIKAALDGLDKELARRERDSRLQRKFATATSSKVGVATGTTATTTSTSTSSFQNSLTEADVVVVETAVAEEEALVRSKTNTNQSTNQASSNHDIMDMSDDWQDVKNGSQTSTPSASGILDQNDSSNQSMNGDSFLGKTLAQMSIKSLAEQNVRVKSPTAALTAILHACLRSDLLDFACTGVPDHGKSPGLAFAPPVRELPKTQFLPARWEDTSPNSSTDLSLRYRKNGTGALILNVIATATNDKNATVRVQFAPANSEEPSTQVLSFALQDHFNLDSWTAAASKVSPGTPLAPSLHYKSLASLLTHFCRTFDLGPVMDNPAMAMEDTVMAMSGVGSGNYSNSTTMKGPSPDIPPTAAVRTAPHNLDPNGALRFPNDETNKNRDGNEVSWKDGRLPSTLDQAFPAADGRPTHPGGDFAGDLIPAGLEDPRFGRGSGRMGGNLMGPNHPMFAGDPSMMGSGFGGGSGDLRGGPPIGGPGSMQPRFDPIYPPGIDGGGDLPSGPNGPCHGNPNNKNRPSRTGEPNPDHLPPPNSLGGSHDGMFM